jgi:glycerol-1-phosphate dehydrogenase [NAD(P)+]
MNAAGYADLLAKVTAGADWLVADALGAEPIHAQGWSIVQDHLRELVREPGGVPTGDSRALGRLMEGLLLGGFAMQAAQSSRPASGAEHQFSHLWDMQHHTHRGSAPSHGFKVGIGTLAVAALYECLLQAPLEGLDVDSCCANWPQRDLARKTVEEMFAPAEAGQFSASEELTAVAVKETDAKIISREQLRAQLSRFREIWPELRRRVQRQLMPLAQLKEMLRAAGAPTEPEQIGISRQRLRSSYHMAYHIRRRFTVLDLAVRAQLLEPALNRIFGPGGLWPLGAGSD